MAWDRVERDELAAARAEAERLRREQAEAEARRREAEAARLTAQAQSLTQAPSTFSDGYNSSSTSFQWQGFSAAGLDLLEPPPPDTLTVVEQRRLLDGADKLGAALTAKDPQALVDFLVQNQVPLEQVVDALAQRPGFETLTYSSAVQQVSDVVSTLVQPGGCQPLTGPMREGLMQSLDLSLTLKERNQGRAEFLALRMADQMLASPDPAIPYEYMMAIHELGDPSLFDNAAQALYAIFGQDEVAPTDVAGQRQWLADLVSSHFPTDSSIAAFRGALVTSAIEGQLKLPPLPPGMPGAFEAYSLWMEANDLLPYDESGATPGQTSYDAAVWLASGNDVTSWLIANGTRTAADYAADPSLAMKDRFLFGMYFTANNRGEGQSLLKSDFFHPNPFVENPNDASNPVGLMRYMAGPGLHFRQWFDGTGFNPQVSDYQYAWGDGRTPDQTTNVVGHGFTGAHLGYLSYLAQPVSTSFLAACEVGHEKLADPPIWASIPEQLTRIIPQCTTGYGLMEPSPAALAADPSLAGQNLFTLATQALTSTGGAPPTAEQLARVDELSRLMFPELSDHVAVEGRTGNSLEDMRATTAWHAFGYLTAQGAFKDSAAAKAWLDAAVGPNAAWPVH